MTSNRKLIIEHNGKTYTGQIATIKSTQLTTEDHGIFTAWLMCEWPGGGVGVGGYSLDTPIETPDAKFRVGTDFGMDQIMRIIETVGVSSWERVAGSKVIVLTEGTSSGWGSQAAGIAHLSEDRVLILGDHVKSWKQEASERIHVILDESVGNSTAFVEIENGDGASISFGTRENRPDGLTSLSFTADDVAAAVRMNRVAR
jgi:hypothetical protein